MSTLENLLITHEGKTLEFKESTKSSLNIIKAVVAFANTAGGTIIIGIQDKTKEVLGIEHILLEEERIANVISDSITPLLIPDIEITTYKNKELIVIHVPYLVGPYYLKKAGLEKGVYIRLGSTNRLADIETIAYLQRLSRQISFDEMPCVRAHTNALDDNAILNTLRPILKEIDEKHYKSLGLTAQHHTKTYPTYGGILLFGINRFEWFPDSIIRCVCFSGTTREHIVDQKDVNNNLIAAVDDCIAFINRHTNMGAKIGAIKREDIPQFPPEAVREVVINAIVHADYAMKGSAIQIAIFSDRIEFTNPGSLPFGQTIESAISGISRMRNRVIGRIFRELKLIERLGSGLPRILAIYKNKSGKMPILEEINNHFRAILFEITAPAQPSHAWEIQLLNVLSKGQSLNTKQIAVLWEVTARAARLRLKNMLERNLIIREAQSKTDPKATYTVTQKLSSGG